MAERGRLMQAMPAGRMLAVHAPAERLRPHLTDGIGISAINAPSVTVLGGSATMIDDLADRLAAEGVQSTRLVTSHAFHTPMMADAQAPFVAATAQTSRSPASLPVYSTSTGSKIAPAALAEPSYWGSQLMNPVRFADTIVAALADDSGRLFLEVGPGHTLSTLTRQLMPAEHRQRAIPCLAPVQSPGSDRAHVLTAIGRLWVLGLTPDWQALGGAGRRRVPLPTYPFERKRHWVEPTAPHDVSAGTELASRTGTEPAGDVDEIEALIRRQLAVITEQLNALGGKRD